jgi:hypothetical protein
LINETHISNTKLSLIIRLADVFTGSEMNGIGVIFLLDTCPPKLSKIALILAIKLFEKRIVDM